MKKLFIIISLLLVGLSSTNAGLLVSESFWEVEITTTCGAVVMYNLSQHEYPSYQDAFQRAYSDGLIYQNIYCGVGGLPNPRLRLVAP